MVKDWMDDQKTELGNPSPHIFTYALGNGADETIPAQLACENDGWFAKVEDGDPAALKHAMIRYFEYFSDKIPLGNASSTPRWSEFYMDSSGQGKMTTVAVPVYANDAKTNKRVFHGVVGIDVLAADFGASLDDSVLAVRLQKRSSQCVKYDFTQQGDTSGKVISPKASEKYCQITPINSEAPYIPTVSSDADDGNFALFRHARSALLCLLQLPCIQPPGLRLPAVPAALPSYQRSQASMTAAKTRAQLRLTRPH